MKNNIKITIFSCLCLTAFYAKADDPINCTFTSKVPVEQFIKDACQHNCSNPFFRIDEGYEFAIAIPGTSPAPPAKPTYWACAWDYEKDAKGAFTGKGEYVAMPNP